MWAGHKERRAGAGLRQPFAESNTAASCFAPRNVRPIHFCEDFTTDGRRWTPMDEGVLSVFISVHPWFNCLGCGRLGRAKFAPFPSRKESHIGRTIHKPVNLYQFGRDSLAALFQA